MNTAVLSSCCNCSVESEQLALVRAQTVLLLVDSCKGVTGFGYSASTGYSCMSYPAMLMSNELALRYCPRSI